LHQPIYSQDLQPAQQQRLVPVFSALGLGAMNLPFFESVVWWTLFLKSPFLMGKLTINGHFQ